MESQAREAFPLESTTPSPSIFLLPDNYSASPGSNPETRSITAELERFFTTFSHLPEDTSLYYKEISHRFIEFLGPEISRYPIAALTPAHIRNYRQFRFDSGLPQKSINDELDFLHSAFQPAYQEGRISQTVADEISLERESQIVSIPFAPDQIRGLLRACDGFPRGDDWRGLIAAAIWIGTPVAGLFDLRVENLLPQGDQPALILPSDEPAARGKAHPIPSLLYDYLLLHSSTDDPISYLFPSLAGRDAYGSNALSMEFGKLMAASGISLRPPSGIYPEDSTTIYELSLDSLMHPLDKEHAEAIMNSIFRTRVQRLQARYFERLFKSTPAASSLPQRLSDSKDIMSSTRVI
jgi:integrase